MIHKCLVQPVFVHFLNMIHKFFVQLVFRSPFLELVSMISFFNSSSTSLPKLDAIWHELVPCECIPHFFCTLQHTHTQTPTQQPTSIQARAPTHRYAYKKSQMQKCLLNLSHTIQCFPPTHALCIHTVCKRPERKQMKVFENKR